MVVTFLFAVVFGAIMSGIVDMWTCEVSKLKEKDQSIWSSFYTTNAAAADSLDDTSTKMGEAKQGGKWASGVSEYVEKLRTMTTTTKLPAFQCSEASILMILDNLCA
ncbi:hypothetical protein LINPERHAP2_LOCUS7750 [Linum perenne]